MPRRDYANASSPTGCGLDRVARVDTTAWLGGVRVVLITDRRLMGDGSIVAFGDAVARAVGGVSDRLGARAGAREGSRRPAGPRLHARRMRPMARQAPVMVNDRLDVALAAGAAGVHLPERGLSVADMRRRRGIPDRAVGARGARGSCAASGPRSSRPVSRRGADRQGDRRVHADRAEGAERRPCVAEDRRPLREEGRDARGNRPLTRRSRASISARGST